MCEYEELVEWAEKDYEVLGSIMQEKFIDWQKPFEKTLDESSAPNYKWFTGGKLNVSEQCLDRHLETRKTKRLSSLKVSGDKRVITYRELYYEVCKTANLLKNKFHVKKGDRVVIYMPMIPEAVFFILHAPESGLSTP